MAFCLIFGLARIGEAERRTNAEFELVRRTAIANNGAIGCISEQPLPIGEAAKREGIAHIVACGGIDTCGIQAARSMISCKVGRNRLAAAYREESGRILRVHELKARTGGEDPLRANPVNEVCLQLAFKPVRSRHALKQISPKPEKRRRVIFREAAELNGVIDIVKAFDGARLARIAIIKKVRRSAGPEIFAMIE